MASHAEERPKAACYFVCSAQGREQGRSAQAHGGDVFREDLTPSDPSEQVATDLEQVGICPKGSPDKAQQNPLWPVCEGFLGCKNQVKCSL